MKTLLLLMTAAGLSGCAVYPAPAYDAYGGPGPSYGVVEQPVYIYGSGVYRHSGPRYIPASPPDHHRPRPGAFAGHPPPSAHMPHPGWGARDRDGDGIADRPGRNRDRDGDGVRNRRDHDRDGDGARNWHDRRPNNPRVR